MFPDCYDHIGGPDHEFTNPGFHYAGIVSKEGVLLIDEAQLSYSDVGFWNDCLKESRGNSYRFKGALAASYESMTSSPATLTPMRIGQEQVVGLVAASRSQSGLFMRTQEFDQLPETRVLSPDNLSSVRSVRSPRLSIGSSVRSLLSPTTRPHTCLARSLALWS